jgi:O-antigen/teichoic acid export membrane protein
MSRNPVSEGLAIGRRQIWTRWVGRGTSALADQGLFAVGNFLLNVFLARWLTPHEYGAFSIAFSLFLLIGTIHTAFFTEPMLVFGPSMDSVDFTAYLAGLIRFHWLGTSLVGLLLVGTAAVTFLIGTPLLSASLIALVPTVQLVLFTWLARRACYVSLRPQLAALGGLAYLLAMLGLLMGLKLSSLATPSTALLAMGAASGAALAVLLPRLNVGPLGARPVDGYSGIARDHWRYGRWALGTSLLAWVPGNVFVILLPLYGGLEATGSFRAHVNLVIPMMQVTSALGILILPALVRASGQVIGAYTRVVWILVLAFAAIAALYGMAVVLWGAHVVNWLYADRYSADVWALTLLAGAPLGSAIAAVLGSAMRARERPDLVFWAYTGPAIVAVTAGTFLVLTWGVPGASLAWFLTYATAAAGLGLTFTRWSAGVKKAEAPTSNRPSRRSP